MSPRFSFALALSASALAVLVVACSGGNSDGYVCCDGDVVVSGDADSCPGGATSKPRRECVTPPPTPVDAGHDGGGTACLKEGYICCSGDVGGDGPTCLGVRALCPSRTPNYIPSNQCQQRPIDDRRDASADARDDAP